MASVPVLGRPALVVVDVQVGFDDEASWGSRSNPECERNIGALIAHARERGWRIVFVRHDSLSPASPLAPGTPGNAFAPVITGEPDLLVTKSVNSAFHGTPDLDAWLRAEDVTQVVIAGITTNHC